MNLLYISNHRFVRGKNNGVYTTGQMGEGYFNRFRNSFEQVTVIGLCEDESERNVQKRIEPVNTNSNFVHYIFIQSTGTLMGRLRAHLEIQALILRLLPYHDRVATKAPSLIARKAVRMAGKEQVPILVEMVGCAWDAYWNHSLKGKILAPILWGLTRSAVKNAPYTVYVTNTFLQHRYPCKGKTIGCSDVALPPLAASILERRLNQIKHRDIGKGLILGTTAAVNVRYKGQEYVILAISKLKKEGYNFEYQLAGGGDQNYLKTVAKKCGVQDQVHFLGALPHEKVFAYLDEIDIYIQPSKTEGLPRALIEAMSRGCPSLGSATGGIPELLNQEFTFHKGDVNEICTLLKKLDQRRMLKEAERSFQKAKEYDQELLDKKRKQFYKEFTKE